ncbi:hypothetical protein [Paucidesulfovibrio longus]|uniref:hypothetical protein n=1 Tax=Paucidesulfovibrio longus TaxID=889 RepID=UPI0012DED8BC|nr:hypothetical protein [Paucidesulfovibrio longus]
MQLLQSVALDKIKCFISPYHVMGIRHEIRGLKYGEEEDARVLTGQKRCGAAMGKI